MEPTPAIMALRRGAVEFVVCVRVTLFVPVATPKVFGVMFPILNVPETAEINDWLDDVLELETAIFCIVLPCMLVGETEPACTKMPRRIMFTAPPASDSCIGPPPQSGAVPPI